MLKSRLCIAFFAFAVGCAPAQKPLTDYVNPMLGTATLWDSVDLGFKPTKRTWGAEVFPGSSLPNAMVQVSPVTKFHSGAGYQYEDSVIYGFTHTNKGHWNLCHIPLLPVTGTPTPGDYCSPFSHERESAAPGYYQVFLDRYGVDAQLSSTLRCAFHKYTYPAGAAPAVLDAVAQGKLRHIFLVGGCDGARPGRNYYTELVEKIPADCLILTLACGKFRFFDKELGSLGDIPRLLDVGQCNDAYAAVRVALALADALKCGVNDLPLSLVLSWYEQKAVSILLTLLALGVKNIRLGPTLPAFVSPNILKVLVEQWNIMPVTTPDEDLKAILG